ncbi:MAG: PAS domain S-box protein [Gammaproteobacteria bacterium]|nr:PAS domain S-box protein [Gammaproteobacteria bacterium]
MLTDFLLILLGAGIIALLFSNRRLRKTLETRTRELSMMNADLVDEFGGRYWAEESLRAERDYSTRIISGTPAIICGIAPNGTTLFVNPATEQLSGYSAKELIGCNWWRIFHSEDEQIRKMLREMKCKDVRDYELTLTTKRGQEKTIIWNSIRNFDKSGNLTEVVGFGSDVTERERANKELRRLRNLLCNVVDSMPSVLVGVDSEGRVMQWNREAAKVTGMSAKEAQGRTLADVFPQLIGEMEKVEYAIRTNKPQKDAKVLRKSGTETHFLDVTVYPLISDDIKGAVIRMDDITERVRIEEMVIQSEKMLSVGGLAAGMAHEINNPLAGILQNVQVIRNRLSNNLPKNRQAAETCGTTMEAMTAYMEQRQVFAMMESVVESSQRAAKIVDNMLGFSRKNDFGSAEHDLAELLDKTVELASNDYDLKKKYDFRQIEIVREYAPDLPKVWCEGNKIQQVFLNLLKNGAQAMAENNETGSSRFLLRLMAEDNGMARIEIEDNGSGMDEATRKRAFEPFFTTKKVGIGTGLGLSVSYFIVTDDHHGTMAVESSPGNGAKFIIHLPQKI